MIRKSLLVYILFALMILTAFTYLLVAFMGERGEGEEYHQAKATETGPENLESSPHINETMNNEVSNGTVAQDLNIAKSLSLSSKSNLTVTQLNKNNFETVQRNNSILPQQHNEAAETGKNHFENGVVKGETNNESIKRNAELPLFIIAGIAYILVGLWMLLDRKGSRIPYILSIIGSIFLITLYIISHTIGLAIVGIEHVGLLDIFTAFLQVSIITCSIYIIKYLQKMIIKY